jgi:uncharacterized protein YbbC (DUF1343 family)
MTVRLGSELASAHLTGLRVGLVCNPASIDSHFEHVIDRFRREEGVTIAAVFGPQHGFRADVQDNMIETAHARDPRRGVPVYSLYSETREPTAEMLRGIDALVIDLQDIGARIYTFIYTMANCLRAGRKHGVPLVVCDRPNPIGGLQIEGPVLERGFESFVGQFPIPMRHGMTIAELARWFNDHEQIGAELRVVPMEGWTRDMYFDDTSLPWVMPSPNMPTLDTAIVYPGTVLFEGTNASEGRGTTRPFEIIGAPWVNPDTFTDRLNACGLPGVHFRPVVFEPTFQKHARETCGGCQIHVLDRARFRSVESGVALLAECRHADPTSFRWRQPPYEYEKDRLPIDILAGSAQLRQQIDAGVPAGEVAQSWVPAVEEFRKVRQKFLLY